MVEYNWALKADPVRPLLPTQHSLILCFFCGRFPANAAPMTRAPSPETGNHFDATFAQIYRQAVELNPSLHDGAVLIGRETENDLYKIRGWSYRLFSPAIYPSVSNKGSAWNSCLAMSMDLDVEALILASGSEMVGLVRGATVRL